MKNSEEIHIGLECCEKYMNGAPEEECCHVCNYQCNCAELKLDALALIRQLEAQNKEKDIVIKQLKREIDRLRIDAVKANREFAEKRLKILREIKDKIIKESEKNEV